MLIKEALARPGVRRALSRGARGGTRGPPASRRSAPPQPGYARGNPSQAKSWRSMTGGGRPTRRLMRTALPASAEVHPLGAGPLPQPKDIRGLFADHKIDTEEWAKFVRERWGRPCPMEGESGTGSEVER